jgi:hypothetical protein
LTDNSKARSSNVTQAGLKQSKDARKFSSHFTDQINFGDRERFDDFRGRRRNQANENDIWAKEKVYFQIFLPSKCIQA